MKNKKIRALGLAVCLSLSLLGCSGKKQEASVHYNDLVDWNNGVNTQPPVIKEEFGGLGPENNAPAEAPDGSVTQNAVATGQKLIRRMTLDYETKEYENALNLLQQLTKEHGGYVENSVMSGKNDKNPNALGSARFVVRIPSLQLDVFVSKLTGVGSLTHKYETSEDVTLQYVDVQSHIEALKIEYDRLLEMLKKSEDVKTMMAIEERLTGIRYQMEYYESQKRTYDSLIDYSTVTVSITEVRTITKIDPVPENKPGYWEQLHDDFLDNLENIGIWFSEIFHDLVVVLPQLLMLLVLPVVAVVVILKKRHAKKAAKAAQDASIPVVMEETKNEQE